MEIFLTILLMVVIFGFGILWFSLRSWLRQPQEDKSLLMLQNQIQEMSKIVDMKLTESTKMLQQQFGQSAKIITHVTEKLTKLDETNKQVLNFSEQLRKLQDILQNPKQRGVFGEYYLEALLRNAFHPKQYCMQYRFQDGEVVDAVIFFGDKIVPIDSKFSLENYNRIVEERDPQKRMELENIFKNDLKKRIDETAKYIRPQEGTTEFAFMFIPAEGIYYDLLVNKVGAIKVNTRDLLEYAINEKKVHIVSPTTFYVALQSLWQGMRDYQIQQSTKEILKNVGLLSRHLRAYEEYMKKLGAHLSTAVNTYNTAYREFGKIDRDIIKIAGGEKNVEPMQIDRPQAG